MGEIILNEYAWVQDILARQSLGAKPSETIGRLAKFYFQSGYKKSEIIRMIEDFIIRCDPGVNVLKWQNYIHDCVKHADKYPLINIRHIAVTEAELNAVETLDGLMARRVLFTLVCLAKYGNAVNPKNNNWVNRERKEIFSLSNVAMTVSRQALLFNDLLRAGYISFSKIVDNVNMNVSIIDNNSKPVLYIDDFRNLGNQYMKHVGKGYMSCQSCGLIIKRGANNQRYCKACATEINNRSRYVPLIAS